MKEIAPGIVVDPNIRFGKPVIEGTRVPVDLILRELAGGMTPDGVRRQYDLTLEQVRAALQYAADRVIEEELAVL